MNPRNAGRWLAACLFVVAALSGCGGGSGNQPPNIDVQVSGDTRTGSGGGLAVTAGSLVRLDASATIDPQSQKLSYEWSLISRPPLSSLIIIEPKVAAIELRPDVLGRYALQLEVTDSEGAVATRQFALTVDNRGPQTVLLTPSVTLSPNTELTLRGSASSDPDGDALSYRWTVDTRPDGSVATPQPADVADPRFTPDAEGRWVLRLRVTDTIGAYTERTATLDVGDRAPVAVVTPGHATVVLGDTARASAALSYDDDGDPLSFQWTLDARPAGSQAAPASTTGSELAFTPDLPGTYAASVRVHAAGRSATGQVAFTVLPQLAATMALNFAPQEVRYSRGLDRVVITASNPNSLRIVDPFAGTMRTVLLPRAAANLILSPDGRLALALHEGSATLVDVQTAAIVRTTSVGGSRSDGALTNAGVAYLVSRVDLRAAEPPVEVFDARTGQFSAQQNEPSLSFNATSAGVFADRLNRFYMVDPGFPSRFQWFQIDPATSRVQSFGGDFFISSDVQVSGPIFLTEDQSLIVTGSATYFRTVVHRYAGALSSTGPVSSFSHSALLEEALALYFEPPGSLRGPSRYPTGYQRFTGSLLAPAGYLLLPYVEDRAAYGIAVFHSASGRHVLVVQTGSDLAFDQGLKYYVLVR